MHIGDLDLGLADVLGRLAMAVLFGALIGYERQRRGQAAGIQTLVLVAMGAAMFIIAAEEVIVTSKDPNRLTHLVTVIGGLIGGVGFLGAGSIIQIKGRVEGITTAAAIWVTAGVGLICGLGEFMLAGIGGIATVLTLLWVGGNKPAENKPAEHKVRASAGTGAADEADAEQRPEPEMAGAEQD